MQTRFRVALLAALALALPLSVLARAEQFSVYVLTGQSNSPGTTADTAETDVSPGSEPADAQARFFWNNVNPANSTYPISQRLGDSGGLITTLQAQQGDGAANQTF